MTGGVDMFLIIALPDELDFTVGFIGMPGDLRRRLRRAPHRLQLRSSFIGHLGFSRRLRSRWLWCRYRGRRLWYRSALSEGWS